MSAMCPGSRTGPAAPVASVLTDHVLALRRRTLCRQFPTAVHLLPTTADGRFGRESPDLLAGIDAGELDHALRVDVLLAGIERLLGDLGRAARTDAFAGLTGSRTERRELAVSIIVIRAGPPELADEERHWLRALHVAGGVLRLGTGTVYAITRRGWLEVNDPQPVLVPRRRGSASADPRSTRSRYSGEVIRNVS